ncbi:hypothetical protein fh0823_20890 [Francisella halioticida]|uniref:Uncharacterized protein n=1 Tax=Francisella halioticida TaxID=549298 RepID=A0ABM6LWX1_9GAMM|nr:hypothetical protein [Francisella halioticida]ASG67107.1 hypothetical protein CDV26_00770 [Francisella halioticida]BCD91950.1 hypothetical protein fh0823_20890 [Francisella halioticida]
MKKIVIALGLSVFLSTGFSLQVSSGSSQKNPTAMNALPINISKQSKQNKIQIDQPKQKEQLIGSSSSTWTPAYLKVKKFKKCLSTEDYRGWQGYCLPSKQPKKCPDTSWKELNKMNLIPCSK